MKKLYEIISDFMGESYVRVYAWANDEDEARALAASSFKGYWKGETLPEQMEIRELFSADSPSFCTQPSDSGFNMDEKQ